MFYLILAQPAADAARGGRERGLLGAATCARSKASGDVVGIDLVTTKSVAVTRGAA